MIDTDRANVCNHPTQPGKPCQECERVKLERRIAELAAVVEHPRTPLSKRPVAFRIPDHDGWIILQSEEAAQIEADHRGVTYQGLYVRNGEA